MRVLISARSPLLGRPPLRFCAMRITLHGDQRSWNRTRRRVAPCKAGNALYASFRSTQQASQINCADPLEPRCRVVLHAGGICHGRTVSMLAFTGYTTDSDTGERLPTIGKLLDERWMYDLVECGTIEKTDRSGV